jgi:hypothetical protein
VSDTAVSDTAYITDADISEAVADLNPAAAFVFPARNGAQKSKHRSSRARHL